MRTEGSTPLASPEGLWPHAVGARRGLWLVPLVALLTQNFRRPAGTHASEGTETLPRVQPEVTSLCLLRAGFVTTRKGIFNKGILSKLWIEMSSFQCS